MCDYCGDYKGTDLHHIVNKGSTHSPEAREASEVIELFSWVCQDCHIGTHNVHNPKATQILLRRNIEIFGRDRVLQAIEKINKYLNYPIVLEK